MIMKQNVIIWMVLSLFLLGCSKEDEIRYETGNELLNKNNITDVIEVFQEEENQTGETFFFGNRKGKDWFALFDSSGILQEEWYGKDRYYRPKVVQQITPPFLHHFKKLQNGNYAFMYYFYPEEVKQVVYLCDNQEVDYGFIVNEEIGGCYPIEEDRFRAYDGNIYDFEGNLFVSDYGGWNESLYTGFQDDKVWVGYYDKDGNWLEAIGMEPFERNRKRHLGYGEYEEYFIDQITVSSSYFNDEETLFETNWGCVFVSIDGDVFCVNNKKVYYYTMESEKTGYEIGICNWFNGDILINGYILLSPKAEFVTEFLEPLKSTDEILSQEECIRFESYSFSRINYVEGKTTWETSIEKLYGFQFNARITMTIIEKGTTTWRYRCDIVNVDGSRDAFDFNLNTETGEVSNL